MNLYNACVLVTGGAHRLGREICLDLARAGAHVVFCYRSAHAEAETTLQELRRLDSRAAAYCCDVASLDDVQAMRHRVQTHTAHLDLIVNSASPFLRESLPFADYSIWHQVTRVSIDGCIYICNEFLPLLQAAQHPAIVNILDMTIRHPWPGMTAHAVAKSGMEALTRQLALELAPRVRVNGIVPGPVLAAPGLPQAARRRIARKTLLGRWGTPDDVTRGIRFLAESEYMTGALLFIDGGESLGMGRDAA